MPTEDDDQLDGIVERESEKLERESDKLERASKKLGENIEEVRSDWRAKQRDAGVPGAVGGDSPRGEEPEHEADDDPEKTEGAPEHEGVSDDG
jgi:hypothetical protein